MLGLRLNLTGDRPPRVLCIGAHSDDIEIGCGGTVLRLLAEHCQTEMHWLVLGSSGERDAEASASAEEYLRDAGKKTIVVEHFRDSFFTYQGKEIKEYFEELKRWVSPDLIFTHYRHDLHQDHRLVSELTWNSFRHHLILEYEVIKYDGDIGSPNFFVHLDQHTCTTKIDRLLTFFKSQADHHWFTRDAFLAMLRVRGIESCAPGNYAEGFYCRKLVL